MSRRRAIDEPTVQDERVERFVDSIVGRSKVVVGVDPSLTGAAAVVVPEAWMPGTWRDVSRIICGYSLTKDATDEEQVDRVVHIAGKLVDFCVTHRASHVYFEQHSYAMSGGKMYAARVELVGHFRGLLRERTGLAAHPVVASQARKFLVGPLTKAQGKAKDVVFAALQSCGAPFGTDDEADGFVVMNWGRTEQDLPALTLADG